MSVPGSHTLALVVDDPSITSVPYPRTSLMELRERAAEASCYEIDETALDHVPRCHPFIAEEITAKIRDYRLPLTWVHCQERTNRIAFTKSLTRELRLKGKLAAVVFFSPTTHNIHFNPRLLIPTIAYQLTQSIPSLCPFVVESIERHSSILSDNSCLTDQVRDLILEPFKRHRRKYKEVPLISYPNKIVVDAPDNLTVCGHRGFMIALSSLLTILNDNENFSHRPFNIIITSDTSKPIHDMMLFSPIRVLRYHLPDSCMSDKEIRHFLDERIAEIKKIHPQKDALDPKWPEPDALDELVARSYGELTYVGLVIRCLDRNTCLPSQVLDAIMKDTAGNHPSCLVDFYLPALYWHIDICNNHVLDGLRQLLSFYLFAPDWCRRHEASRSGSITDILNDHWAHAIDFLFDDPNGTTFHEIADLIPYTPITGSLLESDSRSTVSRVPFRYVDYLTTVSRENLDVARSILFSMNTLEEWIHLVMTEFTAAVNASPHTWSKNVYIRWLLGILQFSLHVCASGPETRKCLKWWSQLSGASLQNVVQHSNVTVVMNMLSGTCNNVSKKWIRQFSRKLIPPLTYMIDNYLHSGLPRGVLILALCHEWVPITVPCPDIWTIANCKSILVYHIHETLARIARMSSHQATLSHLFPPNVPCFDPFGVYGYTNRWRQVAQSLETHLNMIWFSPSDYAEATLCLLGFITGLVSRVPQVGAIGFGSMVHFDFAKHLSSCDVKVAYETCWRLLLELLPRCQLTRALTESLHPEENATMEEMYRNKSDNIDHYHRAVDYRLLYFICLASDPMLMTDPTLSAADIARRLDLSYFRTHRSRVAV